MTTLDISREEAANTSLTTATTTSTTTASGINNSIVSSVGGVSKDSMPSGVLDLVVQTIKYDPDSVLNCPHDFPHLAAEMDTDESVAQDPANASTAIGSDQATAQVKLAELFIRPNHGKFSLPECFQVIFLFNIVVENKTSFNKVTIEKISIGNKMDELFVKTPVKTEKNSPTTTTATTSKKRKSSPTQQASTSSNRKILKT